MSKTRRSFIKTSGVVVGTALLSRTAVPALALGKERQYKAAIIGRTGGGNYGHGFDVVFRGVENVSVEAIADVDPEGLKKAAERSGATRRYPDYREMLEKEKPDIVSIGPRQPDCHKEMALATIEVGASIYLEKPMTETLEEADVIVQAAEEKGVKVALGHTRRFTSEFTTIKALLKEGFVGTVLECRVQGKQDNRVGGEDLIVLGTHDFDIMRFYFGDPLWCFASVTQDGRDIRRDDIHMGREPILVAGDTIRAMFAFPDNIQCYWNSVKTDDHWNTNFADRDKWTFEIHGTKKIIVYQSGFGTAVFDSPFLAHKDSDIRWDDVPQPRNRSIPDREKHPIRNLIHAIETDTEPLCSGYDGRWTIEMLASVYHSQKTKQRIDFPLKDRKNPLLLF